VFMSLLSDQFYDRTDSTPVRSIMQPYILVFVQRTSFEEMNCSVAQCLEVVGEWWSLLIVRDAFLGVSRFDDFQARLGISRNILNHRLNRLVDNGVFERVAYQDHPPRSEYRLTDKGRDLWHVVMAMRQWGDRWAAPEGPRLDIRHVGCGQVVQAEPVCSHCGEPLDVRKVTAEAGPGAGPGDYDWTALSDVAPFVATS
jgi:DNA-binding HxlR family transcriptional regulator